MFGRFFSRKNQGTSPSSVPHEIYGSLVAKARNPVLYHTVNVPDTMNGRFDMMVLHVFVFSHRLKAASELCRALSQEVFDAFLQDMERGLREEGVGDISIPKKLKKMTQVYYGRLRAYEIPLEQGDEATMAAAINRNVFTELHDDENAARLAAYMIRLHDHLKLQSEDDILHGKLNIANIEPVDPA